jgi:hypothetical protein
MDAWAELKGKYKKYIEIDMDAEDPVGLSIGDWSYFKGGIDTLQTESPVTLAAGIEQHKTIVQKKGLDKYVDVFTKIGLVLLVIALIIVAINKPLKKLMHGVE